MARSHPRSRLMTWSFLGVPGLAWEEPRGAVPGEVPSEGRRKRGRSHQQLPDGSSRADSGFLNNLYLNDFSQGAARRGPYHTLLRQSSAVLVNVAVWTLTASAFATPFRSVNCSLMDVRDRRDTECKLHTPLIQQRNSAKADRPCRRR